MFWLRKTPPRPTSRLSALFGSAAPTLVFVGADMPLGTTCALEAAGAVALLILAVRLMRRQSIRSAAIGLALLGLCAAGVGLTGEARGFFLAPTLIPLAAILVCVATILARRPLVGVIVNRLVAGPRDWSEHRALYRVYLVATLVAIAINIVNGALQVGFDLANDTLVLAAIHTATGPVFAGLVAIAAVLARREIRKPGARPSPRPQALPAPLSETRR